jgi:hypothetical protein
LKRISADRRFGHDAGYAGARRKTMGAAGVSSSGFVT